MLTRKTRTKNREAFSIMATPLADSVQATDSVGILCINEQGRITENLAGNCGVSADPNPLLCSPGVVTPPAVANCAHKNCSERTICGNCQAGNGGGVYNYGQGSYAETFVDGSFDGICSNSIIKSACNGNCTNSTVCRACAGDRTGVNHDGYS